MKHVEVYLTAPAAPSVDFKGKSVIVIDVLRAASTILTALNNGARAVIPVVDMAEAGRIAEHMDEDTMVTGGERGGVKIDGYHLGNSPLEYTPEVVQGKTVVLNTSNGTSAVAKIKGATDVAIAGLLNLSESIRFARESENDIAIVCSGTSNRVALEDLLCAGYIVHKLWGGKEAFDRSDAAHIAFSQYSQDKDRLQEAILQSNHARYLIEMGFEEDVAYCSQLDALPLLPVYRDSRIVLSDPSKAAVSFRQVIDNGD